MKHSSLIAGIFTVFNFILAAVCVMLYLKQDRVKPEFAFQANGTVYTRQTPEEELMQGITAYDDTDGDVTGRIVIEKIVENREDSSVVVFYAVSDLAGNVTKVSRVFPARLPKEEEETEESSRGVRM